MVRVYSTLTEASDTLSSFDQIRIQLSSTLAENNDTIAATVRNIVRANTTLYDVDYASSTTVVRIRGSFSYTEESDTLAAYSRIRYPIVTPITRSVTFTQNGSREVILIPSLSRAAFIPLIADRVALVS